MRCWPAALKKSFQTSQYEMVSLQIEFEHEKRGLCRLNPGVLVVYRNVDASNVGSRPVNISRAVRYFYILVFHQYDETISLDKYVRT